MDLREYIEQNGLLSNVSSFMEWQAVNIGFLNSRKSEDEVQFDIQRVDTNDGIKELSALFSDFCKENGFPNNTVQYVAVVKSASTYEELEELTF